MTDIVRQKRRKGKGLFPGEGWLAGMDANEGDGEAILTRTRERNGRW
ncbi:MAG: hypothetical protein JNK37_25295 [Verrucomicrobiales bacterium]|nr:hypothetical protein [Verrucomicrobiales bacterium]